MSTTPEEAAEAERAIDEAARGHAAFAERLKAGVKRDPKRADLARIGYRNQNGSKFVSQRANAPSTRPSRDEVKAKRKAERDRKRDQRRKARR